MPDTDAAALLPPGTPAPPFRLLSSAAAAVPPGEPVPEDAWVSLEKLAGAPVVLVFYPGDFTPVCGGELALFSELLPELERHGARVFGVSVDSPWSHAAFAEARHLAFPLLADHHPKGEVSRRYHSYREADDFSERTLFVVDADGKVFWSFLSPLGVDPGVDGVLDALERLDHERAGVEDQPRFATGEEARP